MAYPFIHIHTQRFPVLPGEAEELINPNMWGKSLCEFIAKKLAGLGYQTDYLVEDWGWLVQVGRDGFSNGVCVYCDPSQESNPTDYVVTLMREGKRHFSLKRFKQVDDSGWCDTLASDLRASLAVDGIEIVSVTEDMPF